MLYDLIYIYEHYIDPLPDTWNLFQEEIHKVFPVIIDTKTIFSQHPKYSLYALENLFKEISNQPTSLIDFLPYDENNPGASYTLFASKPNLVDPSSSSHAHNAGYDSWMTGVIFSIYLEQTAILRRMENIVNLECVNRISASYSQKLINLVGNNDNLFYEEFAYSISGPGIGVHYNAQNIMQKSGIGQVMLKKISPNEILFLLLENKHLEQATITKKIRDIDRNLTVNSYREWKIKESQQQESQQQPTEDKIIQPENQPQHWTCGGYIISKSTDQSSFFRNWSLILCTTSLLLSYILIQRPIT